MKDNRDDVSLFIRLTAVCIFVAFWLWRVLAATLLGAVIGGVILLQFSETLWAKISFYGFALLGLLVGIVMAEKARKRAKGSIPVFEHVYTSHDLDKRNPGR